MIFQSTHSMKECDILFFLIFLDCVKFQSTHSMKECDRWICSNVYPKENFNPRTLWKSATLFFLIFLDCVKFQSTHSMKECDTFDDIFHICSIHFNPRTLWKSATERSTIHVLLCFISIHALYERVRLSRKYQFGCHNDFNPRTLWKSATAFES